MRCVIAINCIVPQIIIANVSIKYFNQPQCLRVSADIRFVCTKKLSQLNAQAQKNPLKSAYAIVLPYTATPIYQQYITDKNIRKKKIQNWRSATHSPGRLYIKCSEIQRANPSQSFIKQNYTHILFTAEQRYYICSFYIMKNNNNHCHSMFMGIHFRKTQCREFSRRMILAQRSIGLFEIGMEMVVNIIPCLMSLFVKKKIYSFIWLLYAWCINSHCHLKLHVRC